MPVRTPFWAYPEYWPQLDPPGYAFLGRAVAPIGTALHADSWVGTEPGEIPIRLLSVRLQDATLEEIRWAYELQVQAALGSSTAEMNRFDRRYFTATTARTSFTDEQWRRIVVANHREVAEQRDRLSRWNHVMLEIGRACLAGALVYALRDGSTGKMIAGDPDLWNTDGWQTYFGDCQITVSEKMPDLGVPAALWIYEPRHYVRKIFLSSDSLATFVLRLRDPGADPDATWRPLPGQTQISWCALPEPEREARRRAKDADSSHPSEAAICRALAVMWEQATGERAKWRSIEQLRNRLR
jgi:hypothetical protein